MHSCVCVQMCMCVCAHTHARVYQLSGIQILRCTQWLYHQEGGRLTLFKMEILPELIFQAPCKG